ncbi:MAG: hypothetical protein U5Q44_01900 [Dehalococcoidia bacterium]|nr:hypothetical protein [Dehalococcoidia bacterium]
MPGRRRLADVDRAAGDGLDSIFQHCEGYPESGARRGRQRYAYLRRHIIKTDVSYVNTVGRPLSRVRDEARLREAIEDFLDEPRHDWSRASAIEVRNADPGLRRRTSRPPLGAQAGSRSGTRLAPARTCAPCRECAPAPGAAPVRAPRSTVLCRTPAAPRKD